ncbi:MAG: hypothetical protein LBL91_05045 [Lachnospiraceae bacterium]|jgi:hypothetical protein|nr:hypothetical protein [Lachnospiraceae bacterium]
MDVAQSFSEYVLNEQNELEKMNIVRYLQKKMQEKNIYFFYDKSVLLKAELAKMFIEEMNIVEVDKNLVVTACLVMGCKKNNNPQDLTKVKMFAKESADFLRSDMFGFSDDFCNICEGYNRYSGVKRTRETDILELVDNFGGMLVHRYDRQGFSVQDALCLLKERNLKGLNNMYLDKFVQFVDKMEIETVNDSTIVKAETPYITHLAKVLNKVGDFDYE